MSELHIQGLDLVLDHDFRGLAIGAGLLIVLRVIALIGYWLSRRSSGPPQQEAGSSFTAPVAGRAGLAEGQPVSAGTGASVLVIIVPQIPTLSNVPIGDRPENKRPAASPDGS